MMEARIKELKSLLRDLNKRRNPLGFYLGRDGKRASGIRRAILELEAKMRGTHTDEQWRQLVADCGDKCVRCGVPRVKLIGKGLTKDHIIPVSGGGSDSIENLQPLCRNCNSTDKFNHIDWRPTKR